MEQENKMTIEEASVNLGCVKKELEEEFEIAENQYKVDSTYENIFGETSKEQRNNLNSLIGFLDDDIIMKTETGTNKLEDVKEENDNVIRRNIEELHFETIQCDCCKVWLEKDEHLECHMLHCLENYNSSCRNRNSPNSTPTVTADEEQVHENDEITPSIDANASYSTPPTKTIDSNNRFLRTEVHKEEYFHDKNMGTTYSNTNNLKSRLDTHTDVKHFQCHICKQRFGHKINLKVHIKGKHSNTNEKEYKCSESSYQTNRKGSLKKHLGIHSNPNEKEYKCSECSFQTNLKSSLKTHLGTHTDVKHFQCDICKQRFGHKISLKVHIKDKHSTTNEKEYKCSECSYQTNRKGNLKKHLAIHSNPNEREYKCSECSYQTNLKSSLKTHLGRHTKHFQCDICKRRFAQKCRLIMHMKNKHSNRNETEYK